jgi:hypothetical protein
VVIFSTVITKMVVEAMELTRQLADETPQLALFPPTHEDPP